MVSYAERRSGVGGDELYNYIAYMRAKYRVEIEMHLSIQEAGQCAPEASITGVGECYTCRGVRVFTWKSRELTWKETSKVAEIFLEMMADLQEEIDGTKQYCTDCQLLDLPF